MLRAEHGSFDAAVPAALLGQNKTTKRLDSYFVRMRNPCGLATRRDS